RVEATSAYIAAPLRDPLWDSSGGSQCGGGQLPRPPAEPSPPCARTPGALLEDRTRPGRAQGQLRAPARGAGPTGEAPQSVVAPVAWLDRIAATAWTRDASGPAALSQGIGSLLSILQPTFKGAECPCRYFGLRALHTTRHQGPVPHRLTGDGVGHQRAV